MRPVAINNPIGTVDPWVLESLQEISRASHEPGPAATPSDQGEVELGTAAETELKASSAVAVVPSGLLHFARGQIVGLALSNNGSDATNDIDIAAGVAAAEGTPYPLMPLAAAITKRLDAAWAVGTNQGGLDTGAIADDVYHVWLIMRSDTGVVDVLFSASATAPTMPANYGFKRRIGSIIRSGATILAFRQDGDIFQLVTDIAERTDTADVAWGLITLTGVPDGIKVQPLLSTEVNNSAGAGYMKVGDARDTGKANPIFICGFDGDITVAGNVAGGLFTDTSGRIHYEIEEGTTIAASELNTRGWIDRRGRDG